MDPRVGVFFVDFATGSLLQLTGGRDRLGAGSGAQRLMTVLVEAISELSEPLPLRWSAPARLEPTVYYVCSLRWA